MNHQNPEDYPATGAPQTTPDEEPSLEELRSEVSRLIHILVTLLVVLALLATWVGPALRSGARRPPTPTPTPVYFRTA